MLGLGFRLRSATPGWGDGVCVCLRARSACTPPPLAGVCGVGVCAWAQVSAAPRHSWLGCWGVCVFVCALRLYPATPGSGVRCGCVCLGWGFGCAPPLLAGMLGCVCACVRAPLLPRPSLLGCAVWACVFGLGLWLRPAFSGWGVGVCVFVCALRLYPATPGWGVRCGCVCLGLGFCCAPRLLAGVLGCVCACVRTPLVPRHSWLGCAVWVCVPGPGSRLRPATPGSGVGVCVCALRLYFATPGWGVRRGCVCLRSGFGCAPPLLPGVLGCVSACVSTLPVPRHSWLECEAWACVFGVGFRLRPAFPGWGVGVCVFLCALCLYPATPGWGVRGGCVCLGSGFGCAPPLLAGMLGCVCACVRTPLVPRQSWLGCEASACVFGVGFRLRPAFPGWGIGVCVFLCALRLYHATPGWGVRCGCVRLGSSLGCAPPLLAGVFGCVCACVCTALVPRHSWLGCAVWVCVLGLGFGLRPATPGLGVGVCVCLLARSACTLALLAGVCGAGVCVWAQVSAAPRLSWLGCWGVRVCVRAPLVPRHSWQGCAVWVCVSGLGFRLPPPLLAGVLRCVCVCLRAPLVPRHSWLGCAAWVCELGLGFRLRPATPGWGVGVCVRLRARFSCTAPLLAGV